MKKLLISLLSVLLLTGCISPSSKQEAIDKKVAVTKVEIQKSESNELKKSAAYNYGAQISLSLNKTPSEFTFLADDFLKKSLILQPPTFNDVLLMNKTVPQLLSTNVEDIIIGKDNLNVFERSIVQVQKKQDKLGEKLDTQQIKQQEVSQQNAEMADVWWKIRSILKWALWIIIGFFGLRMVSAFLPPPWNSIGSIVDMIAGGFAKAAFKVLPEASKTAGVVAKEAYTATDDTLRQLVASIQQIRYMKVSDAVNPAKPPELIKDIIDPILKDKTDIETRQKILEIKTDQGHI